MLADSRERPRYGVDGFPYIVGLGGGGTLLVVGGLIATATLTGNGWLLGIVAAIVGALVLIPAVLGIRYVTTGKFCCVIGCSTPSPGKATSRCSISDRARDCSA